MDLSTVYAQYLADEERTRQRNIVLARNYYAGEHAVKLTDRQKEFLGHQLAKERFALNYCATVVDAVVERMIVAGFRSGDDAVAEWVWDAWKAARMDGKQQEVHHGAINESEYFVLVDWPEGAPFPRFYPHPRYTDPEEGGSGFGCKAHYTNDDTNQELEAVSKRWTESYQDDNKRTRQRTRMNVYYPDRIERLERTTSGAYKDAGWSKFSADGMPDIIPWLGRDGAPLGIPIAHFRKPGRMELWDAIPLQDLINKTAIDVIAAVDAAGFPIRIFYGGMMTSDGKAPQADGSNYVSIFPGCWINVDKTDAKIEFKPGEDPGPLLETLDSYIVKLAQVTDTPISRFQMTRQVAAEGTLKQQEGPLLAKVRAYQTQIGNGWEDLLHAAIRMGSARGLSLDADADLETEWEPSEPCDDLTEMEKLRIKAELGVPQEQLWAEMGYDADEIARMRVMKAADMEAQSNLGGALLEQFERGV